MRAALTHPKLDGLADRLVQTCGVSEAHALPTATGVAERLWGYAGQHVPTGLVGKYGPRRLARAIGWEGDIEPLLKALLETGLLDETDQGLAIHDWSDHADRHVHRKLARAGEVFWNGTAPNQNYLTMHERESLKAGNPPSSPSGNPPGDPKATRRAARRGRSQSQSVEPERRARA